MCSSAHGESPLVGVNAQRGRWPGPCGGLLAIVLVVVVIVFILVVRAGLGGLANACLIDHRNELRGILFHVLLAVVAAKAHESTPDHKIDGLAHVAAELLLAHGACLEDVVLALLLDHRLVERGKMLGGILDEVGLLALGPQTDQSVAEDELIRLRGQVLARHDGRLERVERALVLDDLFVDLCEVCGLVLLELGRAGRAAEANLAPVVQLGHGVAHRAELLARDRAGVERVRVADALGRFGGLRCGRGGDGLLLRLRGGSADDEQ